MRSCISRFKSMILDMLVLIAKGFCQVKNNTKFREKLGSGWVGEAPTRIIFFFFSEILCVFFCFLCCWFCSTCFPRKIKKMNRGINGSRQSEFISDC